MLIYRLVLVPQVPDALSTVLYRIHIHVCKPKPNKVPTFESSIAALEQRLLEEGL